MGVMETAAMLSTPGNQYLPPDYLSPLSTTLDFKTSPLALLAQTCSQIGTDSTNNKPLISSLDKSSKKIESRNSPNIARDKSDNKQSQRVSPCENNNKLAYKPYESNVVTKRNNNNEDSRPTSKNSVENDKKSPSGSSSERKSISPSVNTNNNSNNNNISCGNSESNTPISEAGKLSPASSQKQSTPSASPIIRPGIEILQGNSKDSSLTSSYKPGAIPTTLPASLTNPLCCPPGSLDPMSNPAFRPSFLSSPFAAAAHHHAMFGYPGSAPASYFGYARVKTPGGDALVPVCKDPYCAGGASCQLSLQNQQLLMNSAAAAAAAAAAAGPCPSGCTQCDHQKYTLAMAMSLGSPSSLAYSSLGRPYVCNWIAGESYCGKRFVTSDELLQHLRTHTNTSDVNSASSAANLLSHSAMLSSAALHRSSFPASAPLSPLSAARYHPYSKPGLPSSLPASPYSAFNPTALGAYYPPYPLYGQRLGAGGTPVHP